MQELPHKGVRALFCTHEKEYAASTSHLPGGHQGRALAGYPTREREVTCVRIYKCSCRRGQPNRRQCHVNLAITSYALRRCNLVFCPNEQAPTPILSRGVETFPIVVLLNHTGLPVARAQDVRHRYQRQLWPGPGHWRAVWRAASPEFRIRVRYGAHAPATCRRSVARLRGVGE